MDESVQTFCIPIGLEVVYEGPGSESHSFAELSELAEQGVATAPGQQGGVETDQFSVGRIVEPVWNRNGVIPNEVETLVPVGDRVEI